MYIRIMNNNIQFDIPQIVLKNLVHHVILGLDLMNKLNTKINIPPDIFYHFCGKIFSVPG